MSEQESFDSVELARDRLTALRAHFARDGETPESEVIGRALVELEQMLEKLHARCGLLREILGSTGDVVFAKDLEGRYVMINPAGAACFGKTVQQVLGHDDGALFARASADRIMEIDRVVMSTGMPRSFEEDFEVRGARMRLLTTETAWYEPRGRLCGVIGTSQDVTERRRAESDSAHREDRLRALATRIVLSEECLRQSLAANLHDGLGQDIALAKMKLSALRSVSSPDLSDPLGQIESLVEQADLSLRTITFKLTPPALHDLGLVPALQWLAEDVGGRYGIAVRVEDSGVPTLIGDHMRLILFRAVRELLLNTAAHARARNATVKLTLERKHVHIVVEDDGVGFDATKADHEGYGLFGIREQLGHFGGSMEIDSAPGRGTRVHLRVQIADPPAA